MKKLKQMMKKPIFWVAVILLAGVIGIMTLGRSKAEDIGKAMTAQQTEEVTVRSLVKSVGATGKVISVRQKELTSELMGYEVAEVFVEVGDMVTEGDILLSFDTEDIEENLADAKKKLNESAQKNAISAENAARNVEDAKRTESYQVDQAAQKVDDAYDAYKDMEDQYDYAITVLDGIKENEAAAKTVYETCVAKTAECQKAADAAEEALTQAREELKKYQDTTSAEYLAAKVAEDTALTDNTKASDALKVALEKQKTAENTYVNLQTQRKSQEDVANNYALTAIDLKETYENTKTSYNNTVATQASNVAAAVNSQKTTTLTNSTDTEKKQVEQYQEQLEKGVVTAPFSGIVTKLNVENGDTYAQGALLTIQDCSSYEAEAEIGEYDISDIAVGQKVLIKTEATREEELEGTVVFVSPVATTGTIGSGDVTYTIRIAIDTPNDRLRLDMSASLSIIIEDHEEALTVPYNAVQTDADNNTYVQTIDADGNLTKVYVTVLMESNYYTEISSEALQEGQKVLVVSETEGFSPFIMMQQGGGF